MSTLRRLIPAPQDDMSLLGLYLQEDLRAQVKGDRPFLYTNYVASLDGRIAVRDPENGRWRLPPPIETRQDRRLYHELAAQADAVIVTARHARAMLRDSELLPFPYERECGENDLVQWRKAQAMSDAPALVVVSTGLNFAGAELGEKLGASVHCITGRGAAAGDVERMRAEGVEVIVAGEDDMVSGQDIARAMADCGFRLVYSVAGPGVMKTLIQDQVLARLYLTQVDRLVGGTEFHTICDMETPELKASLTLCALYRYEGDNGPGQTFSVYDLSYDF